MKKKILLCRNSLLMLLLAALGVASCEKPEEGEKEPPTIFAMYGVHYASYQKVINEENEFLDNNSTPNTLPLPNVATSDKTNVRK